MLEYKAAISHEDFQILFKVKNPRLRGISSVGRVLRSHRRGQGFELPILHGFKNLTI